MNVTIQYKYTHFTLRKTLQMPKKSDLEACVVEIGESCCPTPCFRYDKVVFRIPPLYPAKPQLRKSASGYERTNSVFGPDEA